MQGEMSHPKLPDGEGTDLMRLTAYFLMPFPDQRYAGRLLSWGYKAWRTPVHLFSNAVV